jgi:hypothetical protein
MFAGTKWIAIAAIVVAVIAAYQWQLEQQYDAGYDAASSEYSKSSLLAINEAVADAQAKWLEAQKIALENQAQEDVIHENIRIVYRDIPAVETPNCADLGADFLRVFNAAIDAGSSERSDGTDTPEPVDAM